MENPEQTTEQFLTRISATALGHTLGGISLVQSLREELADFISKSTSEPKEDIIKRVNLRAKETRENLVKSEGDKLGLTFPSEF